MKRKQITEKQRKELVKTIDNCQKILDKGYKRREKILKELSKKKK